MPYSGREARSCRR